MPFEQSYGGFKLLKKKKTRRKERRKRKKSLGLESFLWNYIRSSVALPRFPTPPYGGP